MKYVMTALFSALLMTNSFAVKTESASKNVQEFKTIEEAQKHCPEADSIAFEPGTVAPGVFAKLGYVTATFSAKMNDTTFMNSLVDSSCPVGTPKPEIFASEKEAKKIKKKGDTVCLLVITPVLAENNKTIKDIKFTAMKGSYGSVNGKAVRCNYEYTGVTDPETSNPLNSVVVLRSE